MRCPICNAKMPKKLICPYCKVTGDQVVYGSNIEAKKLLKHGVDDEVYLSSTMPYDVNKTRLLLYAIFLGWLGFHNYFIGRYKRGIYFNISLAIFLVCCLFFDINEKIWHIENLEYALQIISVLAGVFFVVWMADIIAICFSKFKTPVKLAKLEEIKFREKKYE